MPLCSGSRAPARNGPRDARDLARRRLHLDHLGAKQREQLGGESRRYTLTTLDYPYSAEHSGLRINTFPALPNSHA